MASQGARVASRPSSAKLMANRLNTGQIMRPILYSFRRCPYAMRARLAIASAGLVPEHREIVLRDKAPAFLAASPKGTVPVVKDGDTVIEESLDVMLWALRQSDPDALLDMPRAGFDVIATNDGPFKHALDRTKYPDKFGSDPAQARAAAQDFLDQLSQTLGDKAFLYGDSPRLADYAILPFVRQFAHVDRARFDIDAPAPVRHWLDAFLASDHFAGIMQKYPKWHDGDPVTLFQDAPRPTAPA
ncbi:glutathione S-transferase [Yoonia sp. 208BN28-4]|uniref:glutathione S-transferase n=1 Tax=Yoonia sp. 208BN28-4 TaxID=3126505 RepID=UPI0030B79779